MADAWTPAVFDGSLDPVAMAPAADVFAYSGINQDLDSILATHAALKARFPDALHILGGPITWSFEQDGRLDELGAFDHLFIWTASARCHSF
jgi:hypothetical protein